MSERVDNSSDIPTLKEVIDELGVFERWYPLGIHLKLVHPVLKAITQDEHGTEMRCITMIEKWLDSKTNPSWSELCKALRDMKEHALADRIATKYCPPKPAIQSEKQPHASNDPLVECQLPQVPKDDDDASKKQIFDVAVEFAFMFATVVSLLGKTTDVEILKTFLESLCDPRTQLPYVSPKVYEHCMTAAEVLKSLRPQFIHSMHLYFLKKIVDKFGCDQAKDLVRQYDTSFPQDSSLKGLGDPLTDEEIEACVSTKRLKVVIDRDPNGVTKSDVEVYQGVIVRNTGIPPEVVVYAKHTPGSVVLMFLIPESTAEIFTNLTRNDLLFLAGSGIIRIELDGQVIDVLTYVDDLCKMAESMSQELVKVTLGEHDFPPSLPEQARTAPFHRVTYVLTPQEPQHKTAPIVSSSGSAVRKGLTPPDSGYSSGVASRAPSVPGLDSRGTALSDSEGKAFKMAKEIYSNQTKDTLRLNFSCDQGGLAMLAGSLCVNCSVKEINLSGDGIYSVNHGVSDEGIGVLAECLHVNQTLEMLDLHGTNLSDRGVTPLADGLRNNRGLRKLDLHYTKLSDRGMAALADGLCNNRGLRELDLAMNLGISDGGIGVFAGCLHVNQTLEKLNLHHTSLSDRGVALLTDGLYHNRGLRELNLSGNNGMSDEGIGVLAGCLRVNQTLEKLNLCHTSLSDRGVTALAHGLCKNRGLRELNLSGNHGISDEGIGVLARCLHVNQTLEKLDLSDNSLSDRGVVALADGLCNNRGLRELNLSWNQRISDEGVGVLAGCLRVNQTLEKLNLCRTSLSDRGVATLADGLCNNRGLRELKLPKSVSEDMRRRLEDIARKKEKLTILYR